MLKYFNLMFIRKHLLMISIGLLTVSLVTEAVLIVNAQYRVRELTITIEQEQEYGRRLQDESKELRIELAKATLPAYISKTALEMGLEAARNENTVILQPKPVPHFVTRKRQGEGSK